MALKLIVGLGNPGREYEGTRHNVGFLFVQCLADCYTVRFCEDKKFKGRVGAIRMCGCDIRLLLPNTYYPILLHERLLKLDLQYQQTP